MDILNILKQLRDDLKTWVTNNLNALNAKIDEKTIPIDSVLDTESLNPIQNKAVAEKINDLSNEIANKSSFSGDYNDLINAPNIAEDENGDLIIVDENGNVIFKVDTDGVHTTDITSNGKKVATETYVDEAIDKIEFPETDLSGYATETYVDNKVADLVDSAPELLNTLNELATAIENHEDAYDALLETVGNKATHEELENIKNELSESITSETEEFHIVDEQENIIASIDENGISTTTVTANNIVVNGNDVEEHLLNSNIHVTLEEKESWNNKSNFSGSYNDLTDKPSEIDLSNYALNSSVEENKNLINTHTDNNDIHITTEEKTRWNSKSNFSGDYNDLKNAPDISDDGEGTLVITDNNGNIIFRTDNNGIETTIMTVQNILINGVSIEDLIQSKIQTYINESIIGGEW